MQAGQTILAQIAPSVHCVGLPDVRRQARMPT